MAAESEDGQLASTMLDEFMKSFQERNPYLKVFSAHLHMDEATPHLHVDFVPFTTDSKRGLDSSIIECQEEGLAELQVLSPPCRYKNQRLLI